MLMMPDKKINPDWRKSAAAIVELGHLLIAKRKAMAYGAYVDYIRVNIGIDGSAANKISKIAKHHILSNPAYFDMLPQSWVLLYEIFALDDKTIMDAITNGKLIYATKYDIWDMRTDGKKNHLHRPKEALPHGSLGALAKVPEGKTLEAATREGLALEAEKGWRPEQVAKAVGLGRSTYRAVRMIIQLIETPNAASETDKELARKTLNEMNETRNVRRHYKHLRPVLDKLWNKPVRNHKIDASLVAKRINAFTHAIIVIHDTCMAGLGIEIPIMPFEEKAKTLERLSQAREAISQLKKMVKKSNDQ